MDSDKSPEGGVPPDSPKPLPAMAFTIDFDDGKVVDTQRYENLVKKSLARHQRVQSMSASWQRPSPAPQRKPPMSAKLPRKTRGYHSEGYFSSDQEDSFFAPSKQKDRTPKSEFFSPPGGDRDSFRKKNFTNDPPANTPTIEKRSPEVITSFMIKKSKSPIVDSIMSRSDILPSRQALNLPLKQTHTASLNRVTPDNPSFNSISSYHIKSFSDRNLDDIPMIADTSSPELDLLTPDNTLLTPGTPLRIPLRSDINTDDGNVSPSSTVSEAGTYTIEADNYTEEQKAKMNIDDVFRLHEFDEPIKEALNKIKKADLVITKEPRSSFGSNIREELLLAKSIPDPIRKVSTDKNVLEISCCYESPTESVEPIKSSKSAKTYLDKIKSRVKNISEKTFQKSPKTPENSLDVGSFTSVTASGVLCSINQKTTKPDVSSRKLSRKNSLTKSNIDSSEYVHHIPRDNLVCQNVSNDCFTPSQDNLSGSYQTPEQILVGKLSHLSLNRCQGDKSWIQEWAESVKKHNKETAMAGGDNMLAGLPPISPRHSILVKGITSPSKSITSPCDSPTKIPSPMSTLARQRAPVPDILTSTPDTESYLQNTQNVISSLQAKLQNAKSSPLASMDHNIFHDKMSKLPVSQLSRSNSLNYRLYRKTNSAENSPLRNPGNYLITGNYGMSSANKLLLANLSASKSLDTESNLSPCCGDCYSPVLACKFAKNNEEKLNRFRIKDLIKQRSDHDLSRLNGRPHSRHLSFDDRNLQDDFNNANMTQSLNLQSNTKNIFEELNDRKAAHRTSINNINGQRMIDQTRNVLSPSNQRLQNIKLSHHRGLSDTLKNIQNHNVKQQDTQSSPIRRSSSFNIVNKNNIAIGSPISRISTGKTRNLLQPSCHHTSEVDCLSEDSDNISTGGFYSDYDKRVRKSNMNDLLVGARCNRAFALRRARLESPDTKSQQNINQSSPRCPGTPEMKRKFSNDLGKKPARAHSRDSRSIGPTVGRVSDARPDVCQVQVTNINPGVKNKKITETVKQSITNRLTRSSSAAKDFLPKSNEKDKKKPSRINMNVMNKEVEFSNWKKRASYDPMKAAQEAKKKNMSKVKNADSNLTPQVKIEEMNSPSNSSPVHRSKSFNCTGTPIDERLYLLQQIQNEVSSDTDDFEDQLICTLPAEGSANAPILKMVSGADVDSEIALKIANAPDVTKRSKRLIQGNYIKLPTDFITKLQVCLISQSVDPKKVQLADKRRTYLIDAAEQQLIYDSLNEADKRRTFVLDSDTTTNSTTNGSGSRRNSSIYSDERVNIEQLSDSDGESDTEPVVNVVPRTKSRSVPPQQRHSGDFSMSSSTCSASKDKDSSSKKIQPRYMDISRYKSESSTSKNFLRRDPTKTYVGVLPVQDHRHQAKKIAAKQIEIEQKNRELEKWKRRASYDPRKAAAQAKQKPVNNKSPSNSVLRSQSFHGPMTQNNKLAIHPVEKSTAEAFYQDISSDNEF